MVDFTADFLVEFFDTLIIPCSSKIPVEIIDNEEESPEKKS